MSAPEKGFINIQNKNMTVRIYFLAVLTYQIQFDRIIKGSNEKEGKSQYDRQKGM